MSPALNHHDPVRKQYFFRPSPAGLLAWDVDRLVELSRDFPVRAVALTDIRELDEAAFGRAEAATWRTFAGHCRLVQEAELRYPIIQAADGAVMDGMHRVTKALVEGRASIDAVRFATDPPPDHVGRHPDDLPYDRQPDDDGSNGYERIASIYVAGRGTRPRVGDAIGAATVRAWARAFPPGASVLDLGSGPGEPSTRILKEAGLSPYAVEASSAMVAAFRERFPNVPIEQNTVEASELFGRTFDGVLAWGLLFLLTPEAQALVIEKVAGALEPGGRFLFTAPKEQLEWLDAMTGRPSQSLGAQGYERLLRDAGLTWVGEAEDEGGNHYYLAEKGQPTASDPGH